VEIRLGGRKGLSTLVDDEDYRTFNLGSYKWNPIIGRNTTYAKTYKKGGIIYLHRLIMGLETAPRSVYVDHIDGNGLNNSRTNLRVTDNKGNQANYRKRLSAKTSSTYKGVCWNGSNNKLKPWQAYITLSERRISKTDNKSRGKQKALGYYRTEKEAALSYNKAAIEYFGNMASLNVIGP